MKVVNRIKANEDFAFTIKNGRKLRADSFVIYFTKNDLNYMRIGVSVSKKLGDAVTRNRIKRQLRAMCDSLIDYNTNSLDLAIVARRSYLELSYQENSNLLKELLNKVLQELIR